MAAALQAVQATGLMQRSVQPQLVARSRSQVGGARPLLSVGLWHRLRRRSAAKEGTQGFK